MLALLAAFACTPAAADARATPRAQTWLIVSDLHLDPFDRRSHVSLFGSDTNLALFRSALSEMRRQVPEPAAVLLPGDFLAHDFAGRAAHRGGAEAAAVATMRIIAGAFGRAYPRARFALALGNNDAPCGDYHSAFGTRFAAAAARIWEPLVDRDGAAPGFAAAFAATGSYVTASPLRGTRLIVFDDVPLSPMYLGNCAGGSSAGPDAQLAWLRDTLASVPRNARDVVVMHVPPGYDTFTTERTRGFVPWPFLDAGRNEALSALLSDNVSRVVFAVAGHAHRFDFRLAGDVPVIVFGALSPIYHNNPVFYALDLTDGGVPLDVRAFAFDEWTQAWQPARSFDAKWNTRSLNAPSLRELHGRLGRDAHLRRAWDAASAGWPSNWSIAWGTWGRWWRIPWCAQIYTAGGFSRCAGLTVRAELLRTGIALAVAFAGTLLALIAWLPGRRRRAKGGPTRAR